MLGGGRKVVGDNGRRLQVCVWMASGFILSFPPLLAPIRFAHYSVCQSVCSCPDTTLTSTPLSFCLRAVCHRAVLIMWVQASSTVLCVYNVLNIQPVGGLLIATPASNTFTRRDSRISNQGHQHLGEFTSFQAPCSLNSRP